MPLLRRRVSSMTMTEPLGVLLLPHKLEDFDLADHARDLLDIPRVVAVEPSRFRRRAVLGDDVVALRQAQRLRFPGQPKAIVLYDPHQYHLARALSTKHEAEVWYFRGTAIEPAATDEAAAELALLDQMAGEVAVQTVVARASESPRADNEPIRRRLIELEVISSRPFIPGGRISHR